MHKNQARSITATSKFDLLVIILVVLFGPLFVLQVSAAERALNSEHKRFYKTGQILDIGEVLELGGMDYDKISAVTVSYSMVKSRLEVDWLYNGQTISQIALPRGLRKKVSFTYDKPLPASLGLRFTGPKGQVAVTGVSALVTKSRPAQKSEPDREADDDGRNA